MLEKPSDEKLNASGTASKAQAESLEVDSVLERQPDTKPEAPLPGNTQTISPSTDLSQQSPPTQNTPLAGTGNPFQGSNTPVNNVSSPSSPPASATSATALTPSTSGKANVALGFAALSTIVAAVWAYMVVNRENPNLPLAVLLIFAGNSAAQICLDFYDGPRKKFYSALARICPIIIGVWTYINSNPFPPI